MKPETKEDKLMRLIRISESVHASANGGNKHARWLLKEAQCNCQQCTNRTQKEK